MRFFTSIAFLGVLTGANGQLRAISHKGRALYPMELKGVAYVGPYPVNSCMSYDEASSKFFDCDGKKAAKRFCEDNGIHKGVLTFTLEPVPAEVTTTFLYGGGQAVAKSVRAGQAVISDVVCDHE